MKKIIPYVAGAVVFFLIYFFVYKHEAKDSLLRTIMSLFFVILFTAGYTFLSRKKKNN